METGGDLYSINPLDATATLIGTVPDLDDFAGLTYMPLYHPVPEIKANGLDGPITVRSSATVFLTHELKAGELIGADVDLWILERTPSGWKHLNRGTGTWDPGIAPSFQGPLSDSKTRVFWDSSVPPGLQPGLDTFHYGVDTTMDGRLKLSEAFLDCVQVRVRP